MSGSLVIRLETALGKKVAITCDKITLVFDTTCNKTQPFLACFAIGICPGVRRNVKYRNADLSQKKAFHVMRVCAGINGNNFSTLYFDLTIDFADGVLLEIQCGCQRSRMLLYSEFYVWSDVGLWNSNSGGRIDRRILLKCSLRGTSGRLLRGGARIYWSYSRFRIGDVLEAQ